MTILIHVNDWTLSANSRRPFRLEVMNVIVSELAVIRSNSAEFVSRILALARCFTRVAFSTKVGGKSWSRRSMRLYQSAIPRFQESDPHQLGHRFVKLIQHIFALCFHGESHRLERQRIKPPPIREGNLLED